jgi:Flagellar hook-length control protein FliK
MLNNQQPLQAMRGAQPQIASHSKAAPKCDVGSQSFEEKLSEHIDSGKNDKKSMKDTDKAETSDAAPTVSQGVVPSSVGVASSQRLDVLHLSITRADCSGASSIENESEMKTLKLNREEGLDSKQTLGENGLVILPFELTAVNGGAGIGAWVSRHNLIQASMPTELSMNNSPSIVEVQLSTPIVDPHFQSSFASQVNFLTNQGITHAKIHLNPQEMGPVSVDIRSVGDRVEVNFQVAREQTRHAIEASIDTLRGLMREEGMTLQNALVRSIDIAPTQAMSASSEQRSNDFQFDRANQFDGFAKNFHQNAREQRQLNDQLSVPLARTDLASEQPSVGLNDAMVPRRLTGIDLFA